MFDSLNALEKLERQIDRWLPPKATPARLSTEALSRISLREFTESPDYCNQSLSPMVAAIADASEGIRPSTITEVECIRYFGCSLDELPNAPRRTIAIEAGGRGGKSSRLLAPKALHAAWTVPLPTLAANEHAVALVISSEVIFGRQVLAYAAGYAESSKVLSRALVGHVGAESFTLRRPDGRLADIRVRAAGARGKGGRAFTLVCALLDEACFFYDESGVVNDREIVRACAPRIVPGGQLWLASTPWIEGVGVLEGELASNWGHHTETLCVRGVGTRVLNPSWDPTGEIEAKERRTDPDNASREIDAIPLAEGSKQFFSPEAIDAAFCAGDNLPVREPPIAGQMYGVGGDAGFTKNSSALAIVRRIPGCPAVGEHLTKPDRYRLSLLEERKPLPGFPLQPEAVAADFGDMMLEYGAKDLSADSHQRDKMAAALVAKKIRVVTAPEKEAGYVVARTILHGGRIDLPPNPRLRQQLRDVCAKPMPGGGVQITSPKRPDGSHGDLVSALVNALWQAAQDVVQLPHGGRAFSVPASLPSIWGGGGGGYEPERVRPAPTKPASPDSRPQPRGQPGKPRGPW